MIEILDMSIYSEVKNKMSYILTKKMFNYFKLSFMAQDSSGRKFNRIPEHTRKVGGKTITVKPHVRSNRSDSKGKK